MKTMLGDLLSLAIDGTFDVIVHGCNCQCTMGAGIAKRIKSQFPDAYQADLATRKGDREKLGTISYAVVVCGGRDRTIVNAYTQYHWRGSGVLVEYEAVRSAFRQIRNRFKGRRLGYPMIGAGLAKGDWSIISQIIQEELVGEDHTLVEYRP